MSDQTCPYPLRSLIRCKAVEQLTVSEAAYESPEITWDKTLFEELARTLLNPNQRPELGQRYVSRAAAAAVEDQLAATLVHTYRSIQKQRQSEVVQQLNALL